MPLGWEVRVNYYISFGTSIWKPKYFSWRQRQYSRVVDYGIQNIHNVLGVNYVFQFTVRLFLAPVSLSRYRRLDDCIAYEWMLLRQRLKQEVHWVRGGTVFRRSSSRVLYPGRFRMIRPPCCWAAWPLPLPLHRPSSGVVRVHVSPSVHRLPSSMG